MTTTLAQAHCGAETAARPEEQDLHLPERSEISPIVADKLRRRASCWLTQAQREFHDALLARDGSDESLDRYASTRAELDSAEAWALRVTSVLYRG